MENAFLLMFPPGLDRIWAHQVTPGLPPQRCGGGVGQAHHRDAGAREAAAAGGGEVGAVPTAGTSPAPSSGHRDTPNPLPHLPVSLQAGIAATNR